MSSLRSIYLRCVKLSHDQGFAKFYLRVQGRVMSYVECSYTLTSMTLATLTFLFMTPYLNKGLANKHNVMLTLESEILQQKRYIKC